MRHFTRLYNHLLKQRFHKHICGRWLHKDTAVLEGTIDRYHGVTVDLNKQIPASTSLLHFKDILTASLKRWRNDDRTAIWLHLPLHYSRYIDVAAEQGFQFHHAENDHCLLKLWLQERQDATPRFATHQVGVCGVVLREDTNELLVVQERKSQFTMWKFPGGMSDLGEDLGDAAVRETFEETGIETSEIKVKQHYFVT